MCCQCVVVCLVKTEKCKKVKYGKIVQSQPCTRHQMTPDSRQRQAPHPHVRVRGHYLISSCGQSTVFKLSNKLCHTSPHTGAHSCARNLVDRLSGCAEFSSQTGRRSRYCYANACMYSWFSPNAMNSSSLSSAAVVGSTSASASASLGDSHTTRTAPPPADLAAS
jgi:hypothetical protein